MLSVTLTAFQTVLSMDIQALIAAFEKTTSAAPEVRQEGERHLDAVYKIAGFVPSLLQIAMDAALAASVRHAAVIYMKNQLVRYWEDPEVDAESGALAYSIIESDRVVVRQHIVDALEHAPEPLRCAVLVGFWRQSCSFAVRSWRCASR